MTDTQDYLRGVNDAPAEVGRRRSGPAGAVVTDKPDSQQLSGYVMRDYEELRSTLRTTHLRRGPTQLEIARRTGMSRTQVCDWLNGNAGAGARRVFELARALGYDLALIPREDRP